MFGCQVDVATTKTSSLSLHDALPISGDDAEIWGLHVSPDLDTVTYALAGRLDAGRGWGLASSRPASARSEEHTSELQSRLHLVCRLLLAKKKQHKLINCDE